MTKEIGRAPFVTKSDNYGNDTKVTLVFFDDGSVKWEPPVVQWLGATPDPGPGRFFPKADRG